MRFDDSLETVLSAEMSTPFGAQSTWRQLVDLIGRGRVSASAPAIARLRLIREQVPAPVRAASARALAYATPPAALVAFFAEDDLGVSAPVLRAAQLAATEWTAILPALSPAGRSVLRHRRDLPREVTRALESFGSVDFVLAAPERGAAAPVARAADPAPLASAEQTPVEDVALAIDWSEVVGEAVMAEPVAAAEPAPRVTETPAAVVPTIDWTEVVGDAVLAEPAPSVAMTPTVAPVTLDWTEVVGDAVIAERGVSLAKLAAEPAIPETIAAVSPFVSIATVAASLPVVAEARRQAELDEAARSVAPIALVPAAPAPQTAGGTFPIAELVARIDAYQRQREDAPSGPALEIQPELFARAPLQAESFRFETDASGVVRWIEGAARAPLIGLSLDLSPSPGGSQVDGVAAGAFRRRAGFANARLVVDGHSDAAGHWRITGIPVFDRSSGRFTGYRGSARRPRADESAEPARETRNPAADALRQLVHELRTPTNAIAGFAEMIESQMLGPVPAAYRAHAAAIRSQTSGLLTAIDDIDMAARLETHALDLRTGDVPLAPLLARVLADLAPLAALRGTELDQYIGDDSLAILGDDRAVERLIARLMATLVASGSAGERIGIAATSEDNAVVIVFDRPKALAAYAEETLLTIDAEAESERDGAPLLGTGFALRLARNLAIELRGSLVIGDKTLTLRLPAAFPAGMEQVSSS